MGAFCITIVIFVKRNNENQTKHQPTEGLPMDITSLIVEAVSGAVGGNVAGAAMKEKSLGSVGNSIAGIGGTILQMVMGSAATGGGGMDLQSILANVGGGGVGGAILMIVVGIIKNQMSKPSS
jgi:hypothetical protein